MIDGGRVNPKGKKTASSLLTLIRYKSEDLYELICELGLDGTFRSQKFQNTFLMPGDDNLKSFVRDLEKLVEADQDLKAIDQIRSLLLKGHLKKDDFKKDAQIGTVQLGSHVLEAPEEVGKQIDAYPMTIITTKGGAHATVVYKYNSTKAPATAGGVGGGNIPVGSIAGGSVNEDIEKIKKLTQSFIVLGDSNATVTNFFKAVASALAQLKGTEKFNRAKFYLAANPIISWFFLVMPGRGDALISTRDIDNISNDAVTLDIIKDAECAGDYKLNKDILKTIKKSRSVGETGDRKSLTELIAKEYKKLLPELLKSGSIDEELSKNVDLKMLMDEIRFMYENAVNTEDQVEDVLSSLGAVDWTNPKKSMVICCGETYNNNLVKGVEAFVSGPVTFVKSIYFMYVPLTQTVEEQLIGGMEKKHGGNVVGGNPALINNAIFTGGAARKKLNKHNPKLSNFVKMLTKSQREEVLSMLQKN